MKKLSAFLVKGRYVLLGVFVVLTAVGALLYPRVRQNGDMKKYLPKDSETGQGSRLMQTEFAADGDTGELNVMLRGVPPEERAAVRDRLADMEGVASVRYGEGDNKGEYALYHITTDSPPGDARSQAVQSRIEADYAAYAPAFSGSVFLRSIPILPSFVLILAFGIVLVILLVMSDSWLSPFLFLVTIIMAIAINMGTNVMFGEISTITGAIAAILQLALSMDYSIMLMARYREERAARDDKFVCMRRALERAFLPIAGSAGTTVVGLLTLVFMQFTIGRDLGFVLAKGVAISLLCVFCVLPALILACDGLLTKTHKKAPVFRLRKWPAFLCRARWPMTGLFLAVFAAVCLLQNDPKTIYTGAELETVSTVFGTDNQIAVLYPKEAEETMVPALDDIARMEGVTAVTRYGNTVGEPLTAAGMTPKLAALGMPVAVGEDVMKTTYYTYYRPDMTDTATVRDLAELLETAAAAPALADLFTDDMRDNVGRFARFTDETTIQTQAGSAGLAELFATSETTVSAVLNANGRIEMSPREFTDYLLSDSGRGYYVLMGETARTYLHFIDAVMDHALAGDALTYREMGALFESVGLLTTAGMRAIYFYRAAMLSYDETWTMTVETWVAHLHDTLLRDEGFGAFLPAGAASAVDDGYAAVTAAVRRLVGDTHARALIQSTYPTESEETFAFVEAVRARLRATGVTSYAVGDSTFAAEMERDFGRDLLLITLLTMTAVFLIVALTFRSAAVPVVLVMTIQGAVYATMTVMNLTGTTVYFLAIVILQSILMGATVDYAILFASHYREARLRELPASAVRTAYNKAAGPVLTSSVILMTGTLMVALFAIEIVAKICYAIFFGTIAALLLIAVFMPAMMTAFDRLTAGRGAVRDEANNTQQDL